jgi:hypothetical protein
MRRRREWGLDVGSSAGVPDPSAPDPVGAARRRLVKAEVALMRVATLPAVLRGPAEAELGAAYEEFAEAVIRRWLGEV